MINTINFTFGTLSFVVLQALPTNRNTASSLFDCNCYVLSVVVKVIYLTNRHLTVTEPSFLRIVFFSLGPQPLSPLVTLYTS